MNFTIAPELCPTRGLATNNVFLQITSISPTSVPRGARNTRAVILGYAIAARVFAFLRELPLPGSEQEPLCDYEISFDDPSVSAIALNPTAGQRAGDFTGWPQMIDPACGCPFVGNKIPASRIGGIWALPILMSVDTNAKSGAYGFVVSVKGEAIAKGAVTLTVY